MKLKLTTLLLLLSCMAVGQSKPEFGVWQNGQYNEQMTKGLGGGFTIQSFDQNKSDTTECWFKSACVISNEVVEKWHKGYRVVFPYRSIPISSLASYRHPDNEYFLYSDKKRANTTVVAVIEK